MGIARICVRNAVERRYPPSVVIYTPNDRKTLKTALELLYGHLPFIGQDKDRQTYEGIPVRERSFGYNPYLRQKRRRMSISPSVVYLYPQRQKNAKNGLRIVLWAFAVYWLRLR